MPEIAALLKTFGRAAATMGLVAAAAATAAGCEPVECGTSRTDELTSHLDPTVQYVADLELKRAAEEVGVGIGIVPHPHTPMMAGLMAMPAYPVPATPPPPVPPGPALPETDAPDVAPELADQDVP